MNAGVAKPPCYSGRLVWPFARELEARGLLAPSFASSLDALDPDMRVPIALAEQQLLWAIESTREPGLGLFAGRRMSTGDCPALDYAVSTAASVREAVETAMRHARLANDALSIELTEIAEEAVVRLASTMPLHRASAEFMMASFYACHVRTWPHEAPVRCLFAHPEPAHVAEYARSFPGAVWSFQAPYYGFAFPREVLGRAMPDADPRLHAMAKKYASLVLAELPVTRSSLAEEIRRLLPAELAQGRADASSMARKLKTSVRTLSRRLEEEGTSFKLILEDVRQKLARHHLARPDMSIPEVACLLGFADVTSFHRAFKRWTQETPGSYRDRIKAALLASNEP